MKQIVAIAAAALVSCAALPAVAQPAGEYAVRGFNPDRSEYVASVRVDRAGDRYQVTWTFGRASPETRGLGLFINNVFAVSYPSTQGGAGLAMFILRPDGSWDGRWVTGDQQRWGEEVWTRRR
jgi:hypothetical protein